MPVIMRLFLGCLLPVSLWAQVLPNHGVESRSQVMYEQQEYDSLLAYHRTLHKQGVDYYFLRYRTAWALYHQGKNSASLKEIRRVQRQLDFLPPDLAQLQLNNLYQLRCYRKYELQHHRAQLLPTDSIYRTIRPAYIYLDYLHKFPEANPNREATQYAQFLSEWVLFHRVDLTAAVIYAQTEYYEQPIQQWQYYTRLKTPLWKTADASAFGHLLHYRINEPPTDIDYLLGAQITQHARSLDLYLQSSYVNFNDSAGWQALLGLHYFPQWFKAASLRLEPSYNQRDSISYFSLRGGLQAQYRNLGLSAWYHYVNGPFLVAEMGYVVNNNQDEVEHRYTLQLNYRFRALKINLYGQREDLIDFFTQEPYQQYNIGLGLAYLFNPMKPAPPKNTSP